MLFIEDIYKRQKRPTFQHYPWSCSESCISINHAIKISHLCPRLLHAECVYWSYRVSLLFCNRERLSHFVGYGSCYCSLSALWDACPDPPWHVALELTLSMRLAAGSSCLCLLTSPIPFRSLLFSVHYYLCSHCPQTDIISYIMSFFSEKFFLLVHEFAVICHTLNKVSGVKSRAWPKNLSSSPLMYIEKSIFYSFLLASII